MAVNLLPTDEKNQLQAARFNSYLLKYLIFTSLTVLFLGVLIAATFFLTTTVSNNQKTITESSGDATTQQQLNTANEEVRKVAAIITQKKSYYLDVIESINKSLPEGVVMNTINLDNIDLTSQLTLSMYAKKGDPTTEIKNNLSDQELFSLADASLSSEKDSPVDDYPIVIEVRIILSNNGGGAL